MSNGEILVDFDGTLSKDLEKPGEYKATKTGPPIRKMVNKVKHWLKQGIIVKIFTGRVADDPEGDARNAIDKWCLFYFGQKLPITNVKDANTFLIYDDRAIPVQKNTGKILMAKRKIRKHEKEKR